MAEKNDYTENEKNWILREYKIIFLLSGGLVENLPNTFSEIPETEAFEIYSDGEDVTGN